MNCSTNFGCWNDGTPVAACNECWNTDDNPSYPLNNLSNENCVAMGFPLFPFDAKWYTLPFDGVDSGTMTYLSSYICQRNRGRFTLKHFTT